MTNTSQRIGRRHVLESRSVDSSRLLTRLLDMWPALNNKIEPFAAELFMKEMK
jgi:hypothetical protein